MEAESKKMRVDRIEEGLAVAYTDDGKEYILRENIANLKESDIIMATADENGNVIKVQVQREETENVKQTMKNRLQNLFNK
ncbi:MAG: DUF3006 domain-containing protein [Clostridia bacterium]|nr:DUF3006 domain-containing protein [Clostridia bacterium]